MSTKAIVRVVALAFLLVAGAGVTRAQQKAATSNLPNILVLMGDDIGFWNLSTYNQGMMGYRTPSIDSIANDGMKFTDTGQLTRKRMETVDDEFLKAGIDYMDRANKAGKPFFIWSASTRMHIFTHLKPE
jgi:arylsulfatase A-like enzyme